jgi:hypothetical protein
MITYNKRLPIFGGLFCIYKLFQWMSQAKTSICTMQAQDRHTSGAVGGALGRTVVNSWKQPDIFVDTCGNKFSIILQNN